MVAACRLPFNFDVAQLLCDLQKARPDEWISHYRSTEYEGDWGIAALRSVGGHPAVIHAVPLGQTPGFYGETPLLRRSPYLQSVLAQFPCPIGAARLMRLGPGARILEHCDHMGDGAEAEVRLHIPIQTNESVHFWVNHERVPMRAGELWYADFSLPHRVENESDTNRVHLVVDCQWNEVLKKIIETSRICRFLNKIGIETQFSQLPADTFLPGIAVRNGGLLLDLERLKHPGDLLHEAGHIAVTPAAERTNLNDNVGENDPQALGQEIAAIAWSYAALKAVGLNESLVFHEAGYKGASDWYISNFESGNYLGLPLLQWMGMTDSTFPAMLRWLR
jgi:hypothetical protein